jgi:hypothetical protein
VGFRQCRVAVAVVVLSSLVIGTYLAASIGTDWLVGRGREFFRGGGSQ